MLKRPLTSSLLNVRLPPNKATTALARGFIPLKVKGIRVTMFSPDVLIYLSLAVVGIVSLGIDILGHKDDKPMSTKTAALWSFFWVGIGLGFGGIIYLLKGEVGASEYYAGYLMEKVLSVDNLMVFIAIFTYFGVKTEGQMHKILTYGIIGAVVFRGIFVAAGSALYNLHWTFHVIFGLIVIWSAKGVIQGGGDDDEPVDFNNKWYIKAIKKVYPVDTREGATSFITSINGVRHVTPLLLCVFAIELTDIIFSFDSVPAVIGVAKETPIIFSAIIMAVLGLRALFFFLETLIKKLCHLDTAVAIILVFVGIKLILGAFHFEIDANKSLAFVIGVLSVGVFASFAFPNKEEKKAG